MLLDNFWIFILPANAIRAGEYVSWYGLCAIDFFILLSFAGLHVLNLRRKVSGLQRNVMEIFAVFLVGGAVFGAQYKSIWAFDFEFAISLDPILSGVWYTVNMVMVWSLIRLWRRRTYTDSQVVPMCLVLTTGVCLSTLLSVYALGFDGRTGFIPMLFSLSLALAGFILPCAVIVWHFFGMSPHYSRRRNLLAFLAVLVTGIGVLATQMGMYSSVVFVPEYDLFKIVGTNYSFIVGMSFVGLLALIALWVLVDAVFFRSLGAIRVFGRSQRYTLTLATVLVFGGSASILLFWATQNIAHENTVERFRYEAVGFLQELNQKLDNTVVVMDRVEAFFKASEDVTFKEFQRFVSPSFEEQPSFQGLYYAKAEGEKYKVPLSYFRNEKPEQGRAFIYEGALAVFQHAVRAEVLTSEHAPEQRLLRFVHPVYKDGHKPFKKSRLETQSLEEYMDQNVDGYLVLTLDLNALIKEVKRSARANRLAIDVDVNGEHVYQSVGMNENSHIKLVSSRKFMGKSWDITFVPTHRFLSFTEYVAWAVLVICAMLTALVAAYFYNLLRRQEADQKAQRELSKQVAQKELLNRDLEEASQNIRQVNNQLENEQKRLKTLMDNVQEGVISVDADGRILSFNIGAKHIFGYSERQVVGKYVTDLMVGEALTKHTSYLKIGEEDTFGSGREIMGVRKSGETFPFRLSVAKVVLDNQPVYIELIRDISDQKNKEAELIEAKELAEHANQSKDDFLANMSHEIRTPMNGVLGMADLLLDTKLNETQQQLTKAIKASGDALLSIINDILDISKIRAGRLTLEKIPFSLRNILEEISILFANSAEQKGVALLMHIDPNVPQYVLGDPVRMRQIMTNLLSNAIKFTAEGHVLIKITAGKYAKGKKVPIVISVEDTGVGIAQDKLKYVFDKFAQEEESTTRRFGGTGLGLNICQTLADLMGGEMKVVSKKGKGSTFSFEVSLPEAKVKEVEVVAPKPRAAGVQGARVMVVEDVDVNRILMAKYMEALGCEAVFASNGVEAVSLYKSEQVDIIFMDCQMPEMDGFEATLQIRAYELEKGLPKTPVIALTADIMSDNHERCIAVGMDHFLTKPIKRADLEAAISQWVDVS